MAAQALPLLAEIDPVQPCQFRLEDDQMEIKLARITPAIVSQLVKDPLSDLACLEDIELDRTYLRNTSCPFTSMLTPSMDTYARESNLTFRLTAFLYEIFCIPRLDDQMRMVLVARHLFVDVNFAYFLVQSVIHERNNEVGILKFLDNVLSRPVKEVEIDITGRSECTERAIKLFGLPPGLAMFARFHALMPFTIGYLAGLFSSPRIRNDKPRLVEEMMDGFNLSRTFATFLYAQCCREIPDEWR